MADVQPLRALHYDLTRAGALGEVIAPPYDVIDAAQRAALAARSPHNVVEIDLPSGEDPYAHAGELFERWQREGVLVRDDQPALWPLEQRYRGPDGELRTRRGFFARVRVEDYGPGRIRPHERTHPGPKEDRLRLTRATRANLSPIFALYSDPRGAAYGALAAATNAEPWGEATDADGTVNRLWRCGDPAAIAAAQQALSGAELLIADGHHRYETARAYARGDRRRGRAPLRADVPGGARGSGPHDLPHPPPRRRPRRGAAAPRSQPRSPATSSRRRSRARTSRRRPARPRSSSATSTPSDRTGCACASSRSPMRRYPTCRAPTASSTPGCSRRCC